MIVIPAYGRHYQYFTQVLEDWNAEKDFKIRSGSKWNGCYVNKQQVPEIKENEGHTEIIFCDYSGIEFGRLSI